MEAAERHQPTRICSEAAMTNVIGWVLPASSAAGAAGASHIGQDVCLRQSIRELHRCCAASLAAGVEGFGLDPGLLLEEPGFIQRAFLSDHCCESQVGRAGLCVYGCELPITDRR